MPRRLCIVSGDLLRCDAFIPALESLSRDDELEIIADRRRPAASREGNQPVDERRSRPYLDLALKVDGFAIVPWSPAPPVSAPPSSPEPAPEPTPPRAATSGPATPGGVAPASASAPGLSPHRFPPASPLDRFVIDDEDAADRERLERILRFKPRRRIRPWALIAFAGAIAITVFATMPEMRNHLSPVTPSAPRPVNQQKPAGQAEETAVATQPLPPVTEAPATDNPQPSASPPTVAANPEPAPASAPVAPPVLTPDPSTRAPRPRSSSATPRVVAPPSAAPRAVRPPSAPPTVATSASVTSPDPIRREMSPSLPGVPRVELSRAGGRSSEGLGEMFTVRVSDISGRPLAGADILVLARMADGTAASIPLSSGVEPGMYQGTMPSGRSSLVDLRVRVTTSDKRVEIPFAP